MTRPTSRRKALAVVASSLATFSLGMMVAVSVAGSASAASPKKAKSPATDFFVINGTVNAASDHAVLASSAFPNFTTGAVDNYYAMAHSHVDNSPFAEGTASPADTGPIGQTAAAGNFQQPQYADARWPGEPGSGKATYGNQGGPYAAAHASRYNATAEASEASNALSAPSRPGTIALPKELDDRLKLALAAWKATWQDRLSPKTPVAPTPAPTPTPPVVPAPKTPPVPAPKPPVITTPAPPVSGGQTSPPVTVPLPPVPRTSARQTTTPSRSLASLSTPGDGMSSLESSTLATFDRKAGALVLEGESRLGRVSLGGGQIEIKGIHVSASIANDGSPTYKVAVSIAAASIGGVPVTIDQDGVHVAGQGQGLPYQQASDALNGALKQAGIQLFLVAPEVTKSSCDQTGTGTGTNTSTTTTSTSSDQSGTTSSCGQSNTTATCDQTGTGTGTSTNTSTSTGTTTTTPTPTPTPVPPLSGQSGTTTTPSSCAGMGTTTSTPSSCGATGTATGTTTTSNSSTGTTTTNSAVLPAGTTTTTTTNSSDQTGGDTGTASSGAETVRATGLHVVFIQPGQSGVPGQSVEHILGEVFVDSLAVPAGPLPDLGLSSSSSSSCLGVAGQTGASGGASLAGGSSSGLSPSGSSFGSASQPTSGSTGNSLPAGFASALRKPLWLLLAYVLWQALVIGTGASLWNWRRGGAS